MRNVLGQTPRGTDFFPRKKIIGKIYRSIEAGNNLFLAAPRRVGKTSIMRALEDNPQEGYHFVYITTESVSDVDEYYTKVLSEVLSSGAMGTLAQKREGLKKQVQDLLGRVSISIKIPWSGEIKLNPADKNEEKSTQIAFEELLGKLDTGDDTIVVMVDEFPQTVENIREKHGNQEAERFLRLNREQRQTTNAKVRFILTGSIGLPAVVKKLTSDSVINDLTVVEIPPLTEQEAREMTNILLTNYKVSCDPKVIDALLLKLKWLIPFHIQLSVHELIDIYENEERPLVVTDVEKAFKSVLNLRNDFYFNHYFIRLDDAFPQVAQRRFAHQLLHQAANNDWVSKSKIQEFAQDLSESDREAVIEALLYDGYLTHENGKGYRFHSALLQQWWVKKAFVQ